MSKLRKKHKNNNKGIKAAIIIVALLLASIILFITAFTGISFAVTGIIDSFMEGMPDISQYSPVEKSQTSRVYASDGRLIATFHAEENREVVPLDMMPEDLLNAVVAIEDERYYTHSGVDPEAIVRAFVINLQTGDVVQGASTITQQVVRNLYIPEEKYEITYDRKLREAVLAYQLEEIYTKEQIMEMYLNTIYLGEGAYGVQAASQVYFDKDVDRLSLVEAALLAGLIMEPGRTPYNDRARSINRRNTVLYKMLELEYITQEEFEQAINEPITTRRPRQELEDIFAPYFVEHVKQELIGRYGAAKVFRGGLDIYTTLDPRMQTAAEEAVDEVLFDPEDPAGALVAIDPETGYIKAMVGGKDFGDKKFNLATQARRQPGSIFKVFALMAALDQGISPNSTFNPNGPIVFNIDGSEPWEVSNYMGTNYEASEMTVENATVSSVNVVYAQLIMRVGAQEMIDIAKDMGITTTLRPYPAVGLGGLEIGVSPLEICVAFATIANYGVRNDPVAVLRVTDQNDNVIEEHQPQGSQVISAINAYRAIEIMQAAVQRGTGTRARLEDRPVAGKTGTTQEAENAWFTGFTTNLVTTVWIGHPEENRRIGTLHGLRVQGGTHPAMIWKLFMDNVTQYLPAESFQRPQEDTIDVQIVADPETGQLMLPNPFTPEENIMVRQFRYGQEPRIQAPITEEDVPMMPFVALMPLNEANHILVEAGFENIQYITEPYGEVPPGYTHRQDPLWDTPVHPDMPIRVWVNP